MNQRSMSKMIAIVLLGFFLGIASHMGMENQKKVDRETFMARQAKKWDRMHSESTPIVPLVIMGLGASLVAFGSYEIFSFCVLRLLEKTSRQKNI